jgi:hypothetical protein
VPALNAASPIVMSLKPTGGILTHPKKAKHFVYLQVDGHHSAISSEAFNIRSGGIEGRPTSLYISSNNGESSLSAISVNDLISRIRWLAGTRCSGDLPVPRLGLVNPEGYIALSLFPHLSDIPPRMTSIVFALALFLSMPLRANAGSAPGEELAKADWSVNAAQNLASNPPSLGAVRDFENRFWGATTEPQADKVCGFRFADLRRSGNLSLIVSVAPGSWGCTKLYIFDKTSTGFELYSSDAADAPVGHDLAHSVLDLNHDGRNELVLWGRLAGFATGSRFGRNGIGCAAEWPLIFAWTGNTYSNVSDQFKGYYQGYLKSVNARLAAYSSVLAPAAAPAANPAPEMGGAAEQAHGELPPGVATEVNGGIGSRVQVASAPTPEGGRPAWAVQNEASANYPCAEIQAAKTEAFLGIYSDSAMNAAIKDSESKNPTDRIAAAVVFSYVGSQEAEQDLRTLSNDADSRVATIAKEAASFGQHHLSSAGNMVRQSYGYLNSTEPPQPKP